MIITQIKYGVSAPVADYEHVKMDAVAAVEDGETPEEVLARLQEWIAARVSEIGGRRHVVEDLTNAEMQLQTLQDRISYAEDRYRKMRDFLARFGVNVSGFSDLPF